MPHKPSAAFIRVSYLFGAVCLLAVAAQIVPDGRDAGRIVNDRVQDLENRRDELRAKSLRERLPITNPFVYAG